MNVILPKKKTNKQNSLTNVTQPISVRCINLNDSVAELYYLLVTADRHTVCWKLEENKITFFFSST